MCPFDNTTVAVSWKVCRSLTGSSSGATVVTTTDRPKSVCNRCVIEVLDDFFVLWRCFLDFSMGVWAFVIGLFIFLFLLSDDDGDGRRDEDCAKPPPSMYIWNMTTKLYSNKHTFIRHNTYHLSVNIVSLLISYYIIFIYHNDSLIKHISKRIRLDSLMVYMSL